MIIALSCTKDWYKYLLIDLYALFNTNKIKKVYLFIEDNELKELESLKKFNVEIVTYNYHTIIGNTISKNCHYSKAALIRLYFSKYIKEDKVLYLDTDAIVLCDISDLWNINIDNYYIAGVRDNNININIDYLDKLNITEATYINSGILLMNLNNIRNNNIDDKCIELINKRNFKFPDQDIINIVCKDKILCIDNKYNSNSSCGFSKNMKIIHYIRNKDKWVSKHLYKELWYKWEKRYYNYLNNDYSNDYLEIDLLIPVYNTSKDLFKRALDSITIQTIKNKLLVTIFDDGSSVYYKDIIDKYSKILNINYIKLKKNKGIGNAREQLLKKTKLPYIAFLDSDDCLYDKYSLEKLFNVIRINPECKVVLGKEKCNSNINYAHLHMYNKIYRRSYIVENDYHFPKNKKCYEDIYFNYHFFLSTKTSNIEKIEDIVYLYYKDNPKSITNNDNVEEKFILSTKYALNKYDKNNYINGTYATIILLDLYKYEKVHSFIKTSNRDEFYKLVSKFYKMVKPYIKYEDLHDFNEETIELEKFLTKISMY